MYIAIRFFTDLQDNNFSYDVGDIFPRDGLEVSSERIEKLLSADNLQGQSLIRKIVIPPLEPPLEPVLEPPLEPKKHKKSGNK